MFGSSDRRQSNLRAGTPRGRRGTTAASDRPARRPRKAFRPGRADAFEALEERRLLAAPVDLAQEIARLIDSGLTTGPVTIDHASLGGFLDADGVTISFPAAGEVDVSAASSEIKVDDLLDIATGAVTFTDDAGRLHLHVDTASATVPRLAGVTGTVTGLDITNDGFSVDSASLGAGTVKLGVFSFTGLTVTTEALSYSTAGGAGFDGDLSVLADEADLSLADSLTVTAKQVGGTLGLKADDFGSFGFMAGSVDADLGPYLHLSASGIEFNTDPDPGKGEYIAKLDKLDATVTAGGLSVTGGAKNFAIDASGAFVGLDGFGVTLGTSVDPASFQWPSWLPIQIQKLGLTWTDFGADPTSFRLDLSASVGGTVPGTSLALSGYVQDAIIDVGLIKANEFPVVGLSGAGIGASGELFGAKVSAELFVSVLDLDSSYAVVADPASPSVAHRVFYGGLEGGIELDGLAGFEVRLGLSQLGPLEGYVRVDQPVLLEPYSGLTISNFRGGIAFGRTLPSVTDPHELQTNPDFATSDDLTLVQWKDRLAGQVAAQAKLFGAHPGSPADAYAELARNMVITGGATLYSADASEDAFRLDGDIQFDTTGKILAAGDLTLGDSVKIKGYVFTDLSHVVDGAASIDLLASFPADTPLLTSYGSVKFAYAGPVPSAGRPAGGTTPQLGTGLALDGTTDDVKADGVDLNGTSFTVEFWSRRNAAGRAESVIAQGDGSAGLNVGFDSLNNFVVSLGGSTLSVPQPDGNWHHWAVSFDDAKGTLAIYEDGAKVKEGAAAPIQGASTTFVIGRSGSTYFDGSVDEVRVWDVARDPQAIAADRDRSFLGAPAGLVASWEFNDGEGPTAADGSGHGHVGTLEGSPRWASTAVIAPPSAPFSGFTITINGGADLTVPGLPVDVSIKGTVQFRTDISNAAVDLSIVDAQADIQPIGVGLGLAGFVHFDFARAHDGSFARDASGNLVPELYGALVIQPSGLGQLRSIGLDVEDAYAFVRFNATNDDHTTDIQVPGQTAPTNVYLPAHSGSLVVKGRAAFRVAGQDLFQVDGELDAYFNYASGTNHFELDALLAASLILGPASSPLLEFSADGFLQFTNDGVAADFTLHIDAGHSQGLQEAGIDLGSAGGSYRLQLNTTGHDARFTTPSLEDPATHAPTPGSQTTIVVPAGPHNADGTVSAPGPYLMLGGSGAVNLVDSYVVSGAFDLLVEPGTFELDLNADLMLKLQSATLLDLGVKGAILIDDRGVAAGLDLSLNAGLPAGFGFSLDAAFQLELNTTGLDQTFTLGSTGKTLTVPAGNGHYALVHAEGDLRVGSFDLGGSFDFRADGSGVTIAADAHAALGPLGSATVLGSFTVLAAQNLAGQTPGIYGLLQASLDTAPSLPSVALDLHFELLVNTTNVGRTVAAGSGPGAVQPFAVDTSTGQVTTVPQVTIPAATAMIEAGGRLVVANAFDLAGEFDLRVGPAQLSVSASATLMGFFGANLSVHALLGLYAADALGPGGLVVDAGLAFSDSLGAGLLSISANPTLMINTSPVARAGVAANTYEVALNNASVNLLGLKAGGTLVAGVSDGVFEIDVPASNPLSLSFFGLGSLDLSGYIRSDGHFSVTGSVGFDLASSIGDLYGGIGVTVSDQGFSGSFSGGANVYTIFGTINLASASGSLVADGSHVHVEASVYVIGIGFSFDFDIGQLAPPPPTPAIYWYSVPGTAQEGGRAMFSAKATTRSGPAADSDYHWTVTGNGQTYRLTGATPAFNFGDPGMYQVHLAVGDLTRDTAVTVANVAPTIQSLNIKPGYGYGKPLTIAPTITDPGPTDSAGGYTYTWSVTKNGVALPGSVNTSTTPGAFTFTPAAPAPSQQRASLPPPPDVYGVTLAVTDRFGGSATATGSFGVFDPNNILVTSTSDSPSAVGTTLRQAFAAAADSPGVAYIRFSPALAGQTITLSTVGDTSHGNSALAVPAGKSYVIDASDAPGLTLMQNVSTRFFYVAPNAVLQLQGLNLYGGFVSNNNHLADGGAVYVDGFLNAYNSSFLSNKVIGFANAAMHGLQTYGVGGAVYVSSLGAFTAIGDTFSGNLASGANGFSDINADGGISRGGSGFGGAVYSEGRLLLVGNTIAQNSVVAGLYAAGAKGAGVYDNASGTSATTRTYWNNIIAQDVGANELDFSSTSGVAGGSNLVTTAGSLQGAVPPSLIATSASPLLGPLGNHGNGVQTYSLTPTSPAVGAGNPAQSAVSVDGRGLPRSWNGKVDIGAYERQPLYVTTTADSGNGSLRSDVAIDDDGSPIYIDPSLYGKAITLTNGPITLARNLTIAGPGASLVSVGVQDGPVTDATLVALWKGENNLTDSAGIDAASASQVASYVPGKVGQAIATSGASAVQFPDEPGLNSTSFTIAGWFQFPRAPGGGDSILASKYDTNGRGWLFRLNPDATVSFTVHRDPSTLGFAVSAAPLQTNRWYYIAATYDGNNVRLYVDGQLAGTGTLAGGYAPGATNLFLGGASWYSGGLVAVNIDEFAYYNTALSQAQIQAAVDGTPANRVFNVAPGANVTLSGLTVSNGQAQQGGAIYNQGTLGLIDDVLSDSRATGVSSGLAIPSAQGGAVYNAPGAVLNVNESTFEYDTAAGGSARGGAIYNAAGARLNATDTTFASDSAAAGRPGYGSDGEVLVDNIANAPAYAQVSVQGAVSNYDWATTTTDPRGLQKASPLGAADRFASTWYSSSSFVIDVNLTDGKAHQVTLYAVDWDSNSRVETITVEDTAGHVLHTLPVSKFNGGQYLTWNVSGHVRFRISNNTSRNAVISGVFFDTADVDTAGTVSGAGGAVKYLGNDATTQGSWRGTYGASAQGGAIYNAGTASIVSTTVGRNSLSGGGASTSGLSNGGAGIASAAGASLGLDSSIVASNTGGADVLNAGTASGAHNVVVSAAGLPASVVTSAVDPRLGPLLWNGGPTPTISLPPGSSAIGLGDAAASATVAVPGLVGWWRGEGTASSSAGAGAGAGSVKGALTYAPGVSGGAFRFNGTDALVSIADQPALDSAAFTISGWFNAAAAPAAGVPAVLAAKYDGNNHGWFLWLDSNLRPTLSLRQSATSLVDVTAPAPLAAGSWSQLTATYDGHTASLYINGALVATQVLPSGYAPSATSLTLGAASWYSGGYFNGRADEVAFYGRALSPLEVGAVVHAGGVPAADQRGDARPYNNQDSAGALEPQPYVVTNTNDSGPGSLRQAVIDDASGDTPVVFDPSLSGKAILLSSGPIVINHDLTITGPGASLLTVDGQGTTRIFQVDAGNVAITGLTLAHGKADVGGAILDAGTLSLENDVLTANQAVGSARGAGAVGGAIDIVRGGQLVVTGSTFAGNSATGGAARGGAIANEAGSTLIARDDTFTGNAATGSLPGDSSGVYGGAIANGGTASIVGATIVRNSAADPNAGVPVDGAGLFNDAGGRLTLVDTIVALDAGGHDVLNLGVVTGTQPAGGSAAVANTNGFDLVMTSAGLPAGLVTLTVDPQLGPLQDNGGPTPTIAPLAGSPVIDAGTSSAALSKDQRGLARTGGLSADIGAYETGAPLVVTSTADSGPGTLRAAVSALGSYAGATTIVFDPALAGRTITLSGEILISGGLTVDGSTAPGLVLAGSSPAGGATPNGSLFEIASGADVTLRGLSITRGNAQRGGGIDNHGTLALVGDTIAANTATSGGGIYSDGILTLLETTVYGNTATGGAGGGLLVSGGVASIADSTIAMNAAGRPGVASLGGGVDVAGGVVGILNTIVSNNDQGAKVPDIAGSVASRGHNLVQNASGVSGLVAGDLTGVDPKLGFLAYNGGATQTVSLLDGSPAIDAGDPDGSPALDQRGSARVAGAAIDIGAFERQPYIVTSTNDSGPGTLRQALAQDNDGSTILIDPSLAGLTITLASELVSNARVTIDGTAAPGVIVSGDSTTRVLHVSPFSWTTIRGLTIEGGNAAAGGGILNEGSLTIDSSTVALNTSSGPGGGISNAAHATLLIVDSTVANNSSLGTSSAAAGGGGGIDNAGTLTVQNSTVAGNSARQRAGGIANESGASLTLFDTIVANNTAPAASDVAGTVTSLGNNLVRNAAGSQGLLASDLVNVDPVLGPLGPNGGPTPTLALLPGSRAIDTGSRTGAPAHDQRGLARVADGAVDIGAFELQDTAPEGDPGDGYAIDEGQPLSVNASDSADSEGESLQFSWDINGDGVYGDSSGPSPTLSWPQLAALGITGRAAPYHVSVRVDDGFGGSHAIVSNAVDLQVNPRPHVVAVTPGAPGAVREALGEFEVTLSLPIDPASLSSGAITLHRDGGPDLIAGPLTVEAVPGKPATYRVEGLAPLTAADGAYQLSIDASRVTDAGGPGFGATSVSWLKDSVAPASHVLPLSPTQKAITFVVTAAGEDAAAGVASFALYVSRDGGPFVEWTTVPASQPSATFAGQEGHRYGFRSVAQDAAGNVESKAVAAEATTLVPDLHAPTTRVVSVDARSSRIVVTVSGADSGESGLARIDLFVSVDGRRATFVGRSAGAGRITYTAVADGHPHTYRFYTVGTDRAGNVEPVAAAQARAARVVETFETPAPPKPVGLLVEHGSPERSYIRYVDLLFDDSRSLASLIAKGSIRLVRRDPSGHGPVSVPVAGHLRPVGNAIELDFGPAGLGGRADSTAADGDYQIVVAGSPRRFDFERLVGDVNGDRVVNGADLRIVAASLGKKGADLAADLNRDGVVNLRDYRLARGSQGRRVVRP